MAKLRFIDTETHDVAVLGRSVEPDEQVEVDDDVYLSRAWPATQWDEIDVPKRPDVFDPKDHTVEEITAYLTEADPDERARVLASEAEGKNRVGVTKFAEENI